MVVTVNGKRIETSAQNLAELIVAKHRNGPIGQIPLRFFENNARFADLQTFHVGAF